MKKRSILALLVVAMMVFAFTACGDNGSGGSAAAPPPAGSGSSAAAPAGDSGSAAAPADTGSSAAAPEVEPVKLTFHHSQAPDSLTGHVYDMTVAKIAEASGGAVQMEVFPASSLIQDSEIFEAVSSGRVDMAHAHTTYISSSIPEFAVLEIPGIFEGGSAEIFRQQSDTIGPLADEILQKYGLKYIGQFPTDTMTFVGNFTVTDPATQLQGKKVRTSGSWNGRSVEAWGGAPVNVQLGDLATALERGTVDVALTTWIVIDGQKFYEITPNVTMTSLGEVFVPWIMNLEKWNSLSQAQQDAIMAGAYDYEHIGIDMTLAQKQEFLKKAEEFGTDIHWSTADDFAYWNSVAMEFIDNELIPNANEDGLRMIEAVKSLGPNG